MNVITAKALILKAANEGKWVRRAPTKDFITVDETAFYQPEALEALEILYREGLIVQVPSAGQAQSSICFKRAETPVETGKPTDSSSARTRS